MRYLEEKNDFHQRKNQKIQKSKVLFNILIVIIKKKYRMVCQMEKEYKSKILFNILMLIIMEKYRMVCQMEKEN